MGLFHQRLIPIFKKQEKEREREREYCNLPIELINVKHKPCPI